MAQHPVWFTDTPPRPTCVGPTRRISASSGSAAAGSRPEAGLAAGMKVIKLDAAHVAAGSRGNGGFSSRACASTTTPRAVGRDLAAAMYRCTSTNWTACAGGRVRCSGSLRIAADDAEHADIDAHHDALLEDGFAVARYEGTEGAALVESDGVFDPFSYCQAQRRTPSSRARGSSRVAGTGPVRGWCAAPRARCAPRVLLAVDGGLTALVPALEPRVTTWCLQMPRARRSRAA